MIPSIDPGKGSFNEPADLPQILANDVNKQVTNSIRWECHAKDQRKDYTHIGNWITYMTQI